MNKNGKKISIFLDLEDYYSFKYNLKLYFEE